MSNLPPPTSPRFLSIGSDMQRVQVLSRCAWWHAHFDLQRGQPVRCEGLSCVLCNDGTKPQLRFVLGCHHPRLGRVLVELRERHRWVLQQLEAHESGGIGVYLDLWKDGTARNSPLCVEIRTWQSADEWAISALVDSLGRPNRSPLSPPRSGAVTAAERPARTGERRTTRQQN